MRRITDAGLPCGVLVAPLLPYLTDGTEHLRRLVGELTQAGATGVSAMALHLRPGAREWFFRWLARYRSHLVPRYERLYARGATTSSDYRRNLAERFGAVRAEFGLGASDSPVSRGLPGNATESFRDGSVATARPAPAEQPGLF